MMPADPPDSSSPGTFASTATSASPALAAFSFPLRVAFVLWLMDAALVMSGHPVYLRPTLTGTFAGLFFALSAASLLGAFVAGLVGLARKPAAQPGTEPLGTRVRAWLDSGSDAEHVLRSGQLLAVLPLLGVYAAGSFVVGQRLIVGMARPEFVALSMLALHLSLAAVVLVLFPAFAGACSWLARALWSIPRLGPRLFGSPRAFLLWLAFGALSVFATFVWRYHEPLSYLPWRDVLQLMAALAIAVTAVLLRPRVPVALWLALRFVAAVCVLIALVAALSLTPEQMFARKLAEQTLLSGRGGHALLTLALDFDHDGYLPLLGGGDCAPFDRTRNPGAIDVPGNGLDEDCDGSDLDARTLPRLGAVDYPVRAEVPKRPPIVLITIDAFAASHLQMFGNPREITPNLDAFARKSALFKSCFSQGPSTRLSFPSIFTSRWDSQIKTKLVGKHPFPIDVSEHMLAESLRSSGYDTVAVLSDSYFSRSHWSGLTAGFTRVIDSAYQQRPSLPHNGPRVTEAATEELTRARTQPLFMWVHYYDAHSPHTQPEDVPEYGKTRRDLYDAELTLVDREVGKLLEEIDSATDGKALVFITGDHGIAFEAPRHEQFNYGYDLSTAVLHVPLIVHAPFIAPHVIEGLASTMDIAPTIVNLLRLRGPSSFEGDSLVPELLDNKHKRPDVLFHEMFLEERLWKNEEPLERASLRTNQFNLLQDRKSGFFELYDWRNDYFEAHDLSTDPRYEGTLRDLRRQLNLFTYVTRRKEGKEPKPAAPAAAPAKPTLARPALVKPPAGGAAAAEPPAAAAAKAQAGAHAEDEEP